MIACGQEFKPEMISRIEGLLQDEPAISRRCLSRRVCQWLDWRAPNGKLRDMSCRKALSRLHAIGAIELPAAVTNHLFVSRGQTRPTRILQGIEVLSCSLEDLGRIEIIPVQFGDREASKVWNTLMETFHYLGKGPLCGAQIRYLIRSSTYGPIGGLAFSAAAWRVAARDQWIGWSDAARTKNLSQVVCNSRFLLVPRTPNLASHVLARCLKRLPSDWHERYAITPTLVETYVLSHGYKGTCYRAANWQWIGVTKGRGRMDRTGTRRGSIKDVYVYALARNARELLSATELQPHSVAQNHQQPPKAPHDWAEEEFGRADFGDHRLTKRLVTIARDMYARPQAHIPQACRTRARAKAAYRFFAHSETTMESILGPHHQTSLRRAAAEPLVFAVQDSTDLNYSAHPATKGLGPIGSTATFPVGLMVHDTMLFNRQGTPLGLLDVQCWARDPKEFGKKKRRHRLPIEKKESYKWLKSFDRVAQAQKQCPRTTFVSIGDRESDIYELFERALADPSGPKLLVRSQHNRRLVKDHAHIWDALAKQPAAGEMIVRTPRTAEHPARDAILSVRFAEVALQPPYGKNHRPDLTLWAVRATESQAPTHGDPIDWKLLTTCETKSRIQAIERVEWYTGRWGIEVYHKTLKSGCRIEERQLGAAERLESCLAVDMVVAWRIHHLAKLGREVPDVPCSVFFEEHEWKALVAYSTKDPSPTDQPPTLREAVRMTAQLGGFLGRKSDREPGTKTLWLGLQRLDDLAAMYRVMTSIPGPSP
jgi:Domain of unknown function (DUF4338)/Transposase DNA-binding/Transposase Tn5 dimerisation domain